MIIETKAITMIEIVDKMFIDMKGISMIDNR